MRLLLDTHAFIWWDGKPAKLSQQALAAIQDLANELLLSVASVWEMEIKHELGKLDLRLPLATMIEHHQQVNGLSIMRMELAHVLALERLPAHHKDPFDRVLIAQANVEDATIVTHDLVFAKYPVKVIW